MKTWLFALSFFSLVMMGCGIKKLGKAEVTVKGTLDSEQVTDKPDAYLSSTGTATATLLVSADRTKIDYVVSYTGLTTSPTDANIFIGASGVSGSLALLFNDFPAPGALAPESGQFSGTLTASDISPTYTTGTIQDICGQVLAGNTYIQLSTLANQGGELRGQLSTSSN